MMPKNAKWIIALLLLITVAAVCVTLWALFFRTPEVILAPDYAPRETEALAETIPNDNSEKMTSQEGGGSVNLTYSNEVSIDLSDERAFLMFANPGKSNQDMVLQIVIQDTVIVRSGRLEPGNQISLLTLAEGAVEKLRAGGYEGKFCVFYYDRENGKKAAVNTEIPIEVAVRK